MLTAKSTTHRTVTVRRFLLITALAVGSFLASQSGNAQNTASATLASGGQTSITMGPNGTFDLTLGVTTNFVSRGYSNWYAVSANGSGLFQINGSRTNLSPIDPTTTNFAIDDPTTEDFNLFDGPNGSLTTGRANSPTTATHEFDAGYTTDQSHNQPAGTFSLQKLQVSALNAPPGIYTLFLDSRSMLATDTFGEVNVGGTEGPQFTVVVVGIVSRKTHGTAGPFDIDLPLLGAPGIECRNSGDDAHDVVFRFGSPVAYSGASWTPGAGGPANPATASSNAAGDEVTVHLVGVSNGQTITVNLLDATANGSPATISVPMGILLGDVDADAIVSSGDVFQIRERNPQLPIESNFRNDINTSGSIESGDVFLVRKSNPSGLPLSRPAPPARTKALGRR